MDKELVIGQRGFGAALREQLTIRADGLLYNSKFVPWDEVRRVKITHFIEHRRWRWWFPLFKKYVHWYKITIDAAYWKIVLDSRITVYPNDSKYTSTGISDTKDDVDTTDISPSFTEARRLLEKFYKDIIIHKKALFGCFDFEERTSWVGAAVLLLLIGLILGLICNALRPLFFN